MKPPEGKAEKIVLILSVLAARTSSTPSQPISSVLAAALHHVCGPTAAGDAVAPDKSSDASGISAATCLTFQTAQLEHAACTVVSMTAPKLRPAPAILLAALNSSLANAHETTGVNLKIVAAAVAQQDFDADKRCDKR